MLLAAALAGAALGVAGEAAAADIFKGQPIYERHCVQCHGADGVPVVPGTPDFSRGEGLQVPDRVLAQRVKSGVRVMPAYGRIISDRDILDVLSYARSLQR